MGASSSTANQDSRSQEQKEVESLAGSTGSLPVLQNAFSKLSNPQTKTIPIKHLRECFCFNFNTVKSETTLVPQLFRNLGQTVLDLFFTVDQEGVGWIEFLRGYVKCCGRMPVSDSIRLLYKIYATVNATIGIPVKLEFESNANDSKVSGYLMPKDLQMLLWMCWIMSQSLRISKLGKEEVALDLPDIDHLILSAVVSCCEVGDKLHFAECDISSLEYHVSAQKVQMWVIASIPGLVHCFPQYVNDRLKSCATLEDPNLDPSILPVTGTSSTEIHDTCLLTCGRAWAISLTMRNTFSEELLRFSFPGHGAGASECLLYRSSLHGKGLSRFWSKVEGYHGPLLILMSGSSADAHEGDKAAGRWVIGMLTEQGFENRDVFYGSFGYLYAINPIFRVFAPSGKDKNFVYSHLHPTSRVYEPHPKPVGIAFGGNIGNERIFIDEDFARVTIRHHAIDRTYKPGPLVPNQGFLPLEAPILDVEVWGLGGSAARELQDSYKKREQLFTEQRRKVDLKTFASWEDSPEKMIMDMMGDPNRVEREDR